MHSADGDMMAEGEGKVGLDSGGYIKPALVELDDESEAKPEQLINIAKESEKDGEDISEDKKTDNKSSEKGNEAESFQSHAEENTVHNQAKGNIAEPALEDNELNEPNKDDGEIELKLKHFDEGKPASDDRKGAGFFDTTEQNVSEQTPVENSEEAKTTEAKTTEVVNNNSDEMNNLLPAVESSEETETTDAGKINFNKEEMKLAQVADIFPSQSDTRQGQNDVQEGKLGEENEIDTSEVSDSTVLEVGVEVSPLEAEEETEYASFISLERRAEVLAEQVLLEAHLELEEEIENSQLDELEKQEVNYTKETQCAEANSTEGLTIDIPNLSTPKSPYRNRRPFGSPISPLKSYDDPEEMEKAKQAILLVKKMKKIRKHQENLKRARQIAQIESEQEEREREEMEQVEKEQREVERKIILRKCWVEEMKQKQELRQAQLKATLIPAKKAKDPPLHERYARSFQAQEQIEALRRKEKAIERRARLKHPTLEELQEHLQQVSHGGEAVIKIGVRAADVRKQVAKDFKDQRLRHQHEIDDAKEKLARRFKYSQNVPKVRMPSKPQPLPYELSIPTSKSPTRLQSSPRPPTFDFNKSNTKHVGGTPLSSPKAKQIQDKSLRVAQKLEEKLRALQQE